VIAYLKIETASDLTAKEKQILVEVAEAEIAAWGVPELAGARVTVVEEAS
jgi:hypothetical protein